MLWAAYGWGKPRIGSSSPRERPRSSLPPSSTLSRAGLDREHHDAYAEGPRSPVRSEHGLYFVPRSDLDSAPKLDRVLVPGRTAPSVTDPRVRSWAREEGLELGSSTHTRRRASLSTRRSRTWPRTRTHRWRGSRPGCSSTRSAISASPGAAGPSLACSGRSPWGFWASSLLWRWMVLSSRRGRSASTSDRGHGRTTGRAGEGPALADVAMREVV